MNSEVERAFDGHAPSAWWVIAWIAGGFLLGAGIGAFVGDVTYKPDPYSLLDFGRGFNVIFGAVVPRADRPAARRAALRFLEGASHLAETFRCRPAVGDATRTALVTLIGRSPRNTP